MNSKNFSLSNELSFPSLSTYLCNLHPSNPHLSGSLWRIVRHVEARAPLGVGPVNKVGTKSWQNPIEKMKEKCVFKTCVLFAFFFIRWILKCKSQLRIKSSGGESGTHKNHHLKSGEVNHTFPSVGQPKMLAPAGENPKKQVSFQLFPSWSYNVGPPWVRHPGNS